MFASEKVMLDYLSQLLSDEEPEQSQEQVSELKPEPALEPDLTQTVPEPTKKTEHIEIPAVNIPRQEIVKPELKLQPISSRINELRDYKEEVVTLAEPSSVEKLLQQVEQKQQELQQTIVEPVVEVTKDVDLTLETQVSVEQEQVTEPVTSDDEIPEQPFQALFFEVAGLVLAVPLQELGGIHNLTEVNSLFGKPEWFKGVMLNREKKLNVVDSARWVMPEKFDQQMEGSLEYKYLITLGKSDWGLAAEKLVETESIHPDAVKWRSSQGKRPWLFGTIKEKMCALLHVSDLIAMLEQGVNARQE